MHAACDWTQIPHVSGPRYRTPCARTPGPSHDWRASQWLHGLLVWALLAGDQLAPEAHPGAAFSGLAPCRLSALLGHRSLPLVL